MNKHWFQLVLVFQMFAWANTANALGWSGVDFNGSPCTGESQGFGPWDFFDVDETTDANYRAGRWWEVKEIHAKPGLSALRKDPFDQASYNRAAREFDYTLRAFPNHPEMLHAVIELEFRRRNAPVKVLAAETPPECYLIRAMSFRPDHAHIFQLMALYLQRLGKTDEAVDQYEYALKLDPSAAEIHYNLAFAYLKQGNEEAALCAAKKAYALGYPLPGLRRKLQKMGIWQDE